jgi:signal transduction histidine kinase
VLAVLAALVTATACWVAYTRVRIALETEFERGLERIARTAASQITPELVEEARSSGEESAGYLGIQVQLLTLRSATGVDNASLIDRARMTIVDARAPEETERLRSGLDSLARGALDAALAGHTAVSQAYTEGGRTLRAALSPVRSDSGVLAAVAVEAEPAYRGTLTGLARSLALTVLLSVIGIAVFAAIILRTAAGAAQLERRLSRAQNLAAMGRLTATLAHEIKNPLAIIRGSAERLRSADPESQRMASFVIEETDRLSRTVGRYLQFARGGDETTESGDAVGALEATLALLEGEFAERAIRLERSRGGADSATVGLDPESLKQVYLNLLLNAVESMPAGGRLAVSDRVRGERLEIEIADEGAGIPKDLLKRLGQPFVTTKVTGSGLGLFLARRLVTASGGELVIRSEVGRGTTCIVRMPIRAA